MVYNEYTFYGPYTRKDGRQHVVLVHNTTKNKKTVSYPKYLMELHLNRYLTADETIDHIDKDYTNNQLINLQILKRREHSILDATRVKDIVCKCEHCGALFTLVGRRVHDAHNNRLYKQAKGPFCSRRCAGIASHEIEQYQIQIINKELITNKGM